MDVHLSYESTYCLPALFLLNFGVTLKLKQILDYNFI